MPRSVVNNFDEDYEPKAVSKAPRTRAAVAASVSDSPLRRSTRIRHGSVNPDGSSPESVEETATLVKRTTRRRAIAVPEPTRNLRSRRNSASSSISENPELESAPGTPRASARSTRNNLQQDSSPDSPKPTARTRRSIRAVSESQSPPSVGRVTRRTRASSIESNIEHATKGATALMQHATSVLSTPSKRRRTQVSVVPSEPVLNEEINEDKTDSKTENEWMINEDTKIESSPEKTSTEPSTADGGGTRKSSESSPSVTSPCNKSVNEETKESEYQLGSTCQTETAESSPTNKVEISIKSLQSSSSQKKKHHSLDTPKELGRKIENLLNKSTEEHEQSPGNKENQKLNVSPEKVKKNLGFTVSNVNIIRESKSVGSALFVRNSDERKLNTSLDERVLSKSWHDTSVLKSIAVEDGKSVNVVANTSSSSSDEKTQKETSGVKFSNTTQNNSVLHEEGNQLSTKDRVVHSEDAEFMNVTTSCKRLDETAGENEILEEFSLYDSNDSNHSLDLNKDGLNFTAKNHIPDVDSETNDEVFEKPILPSRRSRKSGSDIIEKKQRDTQTKRFCLNLERIDNVVKFTTKTSSKISADENDDSLLTPQSQVKQGKRRQSLDKKNTSDEETDKTNTSPSKNDRPLNSNIKTHGDINSKNNANEDEYLDEKECREMKKQLVRENSPAKRHSKQLELVTREKDQLSGHNCQNVVSDSDASIGIADLFQDISADEWNKKVKKDISKASPTKSNLTPTMKKVSDTLAACESKNESDSEEDLVLVMDNSGGKNSNNKDYSKHNEASDSDETVIVDKSAYRGKADKKRRSASQKIAEKLENEDVDMDEMEEATQTEKSLGQSLNPNASMDCGISDQAKEESNRKSVATSQEEDMEMQEILSDAETIPISIAAEEEIGGEQEPLSPRKSQTDKKRKSKSKTPKKSIDVYKFNESSKDEKSDKASDEDSGEDVKKNVESWDKTSPMTQTPGMSRGHLNRNYSIVAVVDSDSRSDNLDDSEEASSDENLPLTGSLFNIESSEDEAISNQNKGDFNNTIDPDVAKELNLAGDDDVEYSDDNVAADECRASESEQSDEDDDGSDLEDFVVADDAVESSEASEDEVTEEESATVKSKYRRILKKSSSEDEAENQEEGENEKEGKKVEEEENEKDYVEDVDNQTETERTDKKSKRKSDRSTPVYRRQVRSEELITKSPEISDGPERLNFSLNRNETSSGKKIRKNTVVLDLGKVERTASPRVEELEKSVPKKKHSRVELWSNNTIDLCTPDQNSSSEVNDQNRSQSSSLDNSVGKKSAKKLKQKNLVEELAISTPYTINVMEEGNKLGTPETKTPKSGKKISKEKSPKSNNKNQRDSIQIIRESEVLKAKVSDLNLSVKTPNSESPITKFLMKEKLNESLPLLELNKKVKKLYDKEGLSKMKEEELVDNNASEIDEDKNEDDAEEFNIEDNDMNDEVQEAGNELNGNHEDDKRDDETDEESDKRESNRNEDGESDNEDEDEEEEDSNDDEVFENEKNKSITEITEQPETKMLEKRRKSKSKKFEPKPEDSIISQNESSITSNRKAQNKASTTSTMNGAENFTEDPSEDEENSTKKRKSLKESTARKKRARLESSGTPQTPQLTKKMRLLSNTGKSQQEDSDSDEGPDSIGFREARTEALQAMKNVATSLKAAKEAKKKKKQDQLERVRQEREVKVGKKSASKEPAIGRLKRLPDDLLNNLSDLPQRPQKRKKLSKKTEQIMPSRQMFAPGEPLKSSIRIENHSSPLSTAGGTTQFSVVNLQKVKKHPPKAPSVASFREQMLARNPRQPVSAFFMYQAKQKASGKHLLFQK
ncbi:transcriptional regulator ATRX [Neodiprion lecontei]|uniref:Transcriptional regulator ATRX n=1 Tax=Neodiprion lecontei TaxID=441921 RepID=A0A6J0BKK6_NEOLC|nr:transcriptional regulator ATRX [Neodiprion lecontei]